MLMMKKRRAFCEKDISQTTIHCIFCVMSHCIIDCAVHLPDITASCELKRCFTL
jgi:hypothetical protein